MTAEITIDTAPDPVCCSGCRSARTPRERCRCECRGRHHGVVFADDRDNIPSADANRSAA